jgi:hypothetical protein
MNGKVVSEKEAELDVAQGYGHKCLNEGFE